MKRLCAIVLIFEAVVIGLSIPVAIQVEHLAPGSALAAGGIAVGAAMTFAVLARAFLPATLVGGSLVQVFAIAAGAIVPVMYFLGGVFAALWALGIWLGRRIDQPVRP